jgi:NitT/TauT family transport system substrate-binding protein
MRHHSIARLVAGFAAALVATAAAAQAPTKIRFQLDWRADGQLSPFFMGNCKGYFKQEGVEVQFDAGAGSALAVQRTASSAYDMGFGDTSSLIEFVANNYHNPQARLRAVYVVYDATPAGVMTLKKSGIAKPADLPGKTLGAPIFDAGRKLWPLFARAQKIDPTTVKWQTMEPRLREVMLAKGEVDAITGFVGPSLISLNEAGVKDPDIVYFNYKDYGVTVYGNAILANERFIKEQPQAIAAFLRAYNRALKDTIANPMEGIKCTKQREAILVDEIELKRLTTVLNNYVMTPNVRANGLGSFNKIRLDTQVDDVVSAFQLKVRPDTDLLIDSSFLPPSGDRQLPR